MALLQAAEILNVWCERQDDELRRPRNTAVHVYDTTSSKTTDKKIAGMRTPDAVNPTERVVRTAAAALHLEKNLPPEKGLALEHAAVPLALLFLQFSCYWPHAAADYVTRGASDPAGLANMAVRGTVEVDAPAIRAVWETLSPQFSLSVLAHNERLQQARRTTQAFNRWKNLVLGRCRSALPERFGRAPR